MQVGKFLKNIKHARQNRRVGGIFFLKINKRADQNIRAGGIFFSKSINVQTQIRPCRGEFLLKINKRACTSIRYTRVCSLFPLKHPAHILPDEILVERT